MKTLIIITGAPGTGKTTTAKELHNILPNNAMLEGDWVRRINPWELPPETKAMYEDNVVTVLGNYLKNSQIQNVIFSACCKNSEFIKAVLARLSAHYKFNAQWYTLTCPNATRVQRLRDDTNGEFIDARIEITERDHWDTNYDDHDSTKIDTTKLTARQVAEKIAKGAK